MSDLLAGRRIALGVSGSIAAYKALTLASRLTAAGAAVDVILTRGAQELVRPLAFQALTHRLVVTDLWHPVGVTALDHIAIARAIDLLLVAPATADVIARLALGRADDALTTTALATRAPLLVAPAMEAQMWSHPATQAHAAVLRQRGVWFVGPEEGRMASGLRGVGRLAGAGTILEHVRLCLSQAGPLAGRRVLVVSGPTREPLDPVRYLTNRSSGRMGLALLRAARDRGASVCLVRGPSDLPEPVGVEVVAVETAAEMCAAVLDRAPTCDAVLMAAAVADYRPAEVRPVKIKKGEAEMVLRLVANPDVLVSLDQALAGTAPRPLRVGFAAETDDLIARATAKRERKGLDLIVANPVPESFGSTTSRAVLIDANGATDLGRRSKDEVADAILDYLQRRWAAPSAASTLAPEVR